MENEKQWDFGASTNPFTPGNPILTDPSKAQLAYPIQDLRGETTWNQVERSGNLDWVYRRSHSWTAVATDQVFTDLPVADLYMIVLRAVNNFSGTNNIALHLNGASDGNYTFRDIRAPDVFNTAAANSILVVSFTAVNQVLICQIMIQGRHHNGDKAVTIVPSAYSISLFYQVLNGMKINDSTDLTSISLITATTQNWSGKADIYSYTFRS